MLWTYWMLDAQEIDNQAVERRIPWMLKYMWYEVWSWAFVEEDLLNSFKQIETGMWNITSTEPYILQFDFFKSRYNILSESKLDIKWLLKHPIYKYKS